MKKLLTIILTAACVLSLAACGSSSSSKSSSEPAAEASSAADASLADASSTEVSSTEASSNAASSTEASSNTASSTVASSDAASSTVASSNAASSTDEAASTESTAAESSVLATITDGVLTMGTNAAFPPYEYYEGETVVGIDAEVAGAIAEALGLKLEIVDMDFSSIITSVQTGKIDIGAAGMTVTEERLKNVNFSDSYSTGVQVIIVPEDSKIKSVDDLEGALIGCQEGTTGFFYCSDDYGEENVVAYTNGATAVQALNDGKVDCVVIDQQPAINFVDANEGLVILDTEYVVEDYAIAVSKDNEALLEAINAVLKDMKESGQVQNILNKYIK